MGWFKLSTLDLPLFPKSIAEFYSSLPKSLINNKKEEYDIDRLKFRFCGNDYTISDEILVSLLGLIPYDKVLDDLEFHHFEIWTFLIGKKEPFLAV